MTRSLRLLPGSFATAALMGAVLAAIALAAVPRAVAARCTAPTPIEEAVRTADLVILGTVAAVAEEGTRATVRVEEIWRGPVVAAEVVVWGGSRRANLGRSNVRGRDAGTCSPSCSVRTAG